MANFIVLLYWSYIVYIIHKCSNKIIPMVEWKNRDSPAELYIFCLVLNVFGMHSHKITFESHQFQYNQPTPFGIAETWQIAANWYPKCKCSQPCFVVSGESVQNLATGTLKEESVSFFFFSLFFFFLMKKEPVSFSLSRRMVNSYLHTIDLATVGKSKWLPLHPARCLKHSMWGEWAMEPTLSLL